MEVNEHRVKPIVEEPSYILLVPYKKTKRVTDSIRKDFGSLLISES